MSGAPFLCSAGSQSRHSLKPFLAPCRGSGDSPAPKPFSRSWREDCYQRERLEESVESYRLAPPPPPWEEFSLPFLLPL